MARPATSALVALVALAGLLVAGCAQVVPGRASAAAPALGVVQTDPSGTTDPADTADLAGRTASADPADVATASVTALQAFWRVQFPATFGRPWRDIRRFVPVHAHDRDVPCVASAAEVAGQAFYCPSADAVVWDADGLIPRVAREDGPTGVLVVLAHEVGHAVQSRLGVDAQQSRRPASFPTILLEAMADCAAGVALAHFTATPAPGLVLGARDRDQAMSALVAFRDPVGVAPTDAAAHGNAFDRVSAFQDGFEGSPATCAAMTTTNRTFTQTAFGSRDDAARRGNLPPDQLLAGVGADAPTSFGRIAAAAGAAAWVPPGLRTVAVACQNARQGPAAWCADDDTVVVDRRGLADLERRWGDYAGGTLIASRYGLAVLAALGRPVTGPAAGAAAGCLAGAYTGKLLSGGDTFTLSPGDLDEAVQVLLAGDWAARDADGVAAARTSGYERIRRFRTGVSDGAAACLR